MGMGCEIRRTPSGFRFMELKPLLGGEFHPQPSEREPAQRL
jgi:hypothetical protein